MTYAIEVLIAAVTLIIQFAVDSQRTKDANARLAHETRIRQIFDAVKARFGITYDQLNQLAGKLDIKLSQLMDATKGSARLSTASRILRQFVKEYPENVDAINKKKNEIQNLMNNIDATKEAAAAKIQTSKRGGDDAYSNTDAYNDAINLINKGNEVIGESSNSVDTTLVQKPEPDRTYYGDGGTTTFEGPSGQQYTVPTTWHIH